MPRLRLTYDRQPERSLADRQQMLSQRLLEAQEIVGKDHLPDDVVSDLMYAGLCIMGGDKAKYNPYRWKDD